MVLELPEEVKYLEYETYLPGRFVLDDGRFVSIAARKAEDDLNALLKEEPPFMLYVPPRKLEEVHVHLSARTGFEEAVPRCDKGEKYSIRKRLANPWELHLRLYENGFIDAEVEVQREYLERLGDRRLYVVYEPFWYYRDVYNNLHIFYKPLNRWVAEVTNNLKVRLKPPQSLTVLT